MISKLATWVIVLGCFSYPFTTVLLLKLGVSVEIGNLVLKSLFAGVYLLAFLCGIAKSRNFLNTVSISIIVFFLIYACRLIIDTQFRNIDMIFYSNSYLYLYYFLLTVLPCLAVITLIPFTDKEYMIKVFFYSLIICNLSYSVYFLTEGVESLIEQLSQRAEVKGEVDDIAVVINPITVGVFGASLIMFAVAKLIVSKQLNFVPKLMYSICCIVGVSNIFLSASRGPVAVVLLVGMVLGAFYFKYNGVKLKFFVQLGIVLLVLVISFKSTLGKVINVEDVFLFKRLENFNESIESGEKEARSYSFEGAYNDFADSPVVGKQFVGTYDRFYPHNVLLEVLMATGIFGGFFFIWALFRVFISFKNTWYTQGSKIDLIILAIGLCNFIIGMTSGSIPSAPEFWILLTVLIMLPKFKKEECTEY